MKCFKNLEQECNPRYCKIDCYIKEKKKDLLEPFTCSDPEDTQTMINNKFLDTYQKLCYGVLDESISITRKEHGQYPNKAAINKVQEAIKEITEI